MTILVDVVTEDTRTGTTSPQTFSHVAASSGVKGVVLAITHGASSTDHVSAASYGGVALTRKVRTTDTATEAGAAELWFLGASVPQGTQTVSYTPGATTDDILCVCITLTGDADLNVIDTDSVSADGSGGTLANPSLTLQNTTKVGTSAMAFASFYSGLAAQSSITAGTNCSLVGSGADFGNFCAHTLRQTTAQTGTGDFTIAATAAIDDVAFVAMVVAEQRTPLVAAVGSFTLTGQDVTLSTQMGRGGDPAPLPHLGLLLPSSAARTIAADYGSFTLTGQDAGLAFGHVVTAANGSFTLTGQDAGLALGHVLTAASGSFTETGQDATLTAQRVLTAANGSFALTGQDAGVAKSYIPLTAANGSFTLTGQDAGLAKGSALTADYGAFTLTGQDATLTKSGTAASLTAAVGSFTLTGQDAGLAFGHVVTAASGSFTLTGQAAGLAFGHVLTADYGSFALTGANAVVDIDMSAANGAFTLTGQDAGLTFGRVLTAASGSFALTGQSATLAEGHVLTAASGSFALTGQDASLTEQRVLTAAYGSFTLTGQDVTLTYSAPTARTLTADYGSFALTGQDAGLAKSYVPLTAANGSFALTGQDVGLTAQRVQTADYGAFTLTGQDVALTAQRWLTADYGGYTLTGQAATFVKGYSLTAATGVFTISGQDVGLLLGSRTLSAEAGYFTLTGGDAWVPDTVPVEQPSGGYGWQNEYNAELQRRLRRKLRLEEDEDVVEAALESAGVELPATVTEAPATDLQRLRGLVSAFSQTYDLNNRTQRAVDYARRAQSAFSYELALREIAKELEDEEHALVMTLAML